MIKPKRRKYVIPGILCIILGLACLTMPFDLWVNLIFTSLFFAGAVICLGG